VKAASQQSHQSQQAANLICLCLKVEIPRIGEYSRHAYGGRIPGPSFLQEIIFFHSQPQTLLKDFKFDLINP
jgi:hypothetical protein